MSHIQIKSRFTDAIIFEGDYLSIMEAVADAVNKGANLIGANLLGLSTKQIPVYLPVVYAANSKRGVTLADIRKHIASRTTKPTGLRFKKSQA